VPRWSAAIYRAELARALQRLGYEVEVTHQDGRFEVKGFGKEQLRHFSRRGEEIEAALKDLGASGAKASAMLALVTRARKLETLGARNANELDVVLHTMPRNTVDGLLVANDLFLVVNRAKITQAVRNAKLPTIFPFPQALASPA
jgi:hypothetical protein